MVGLFNLVCFFFFSCALFGKECCNCRGLSCRPQPSVTMTHIHNLCTASCPRLLTFSLQTRATAAQLCNTHAQTHTWPTHIHTHTDCSWLIRIRGSHEEALGFHGTPLRIDPPLSGTSQTRYTNTPCELLPVGVHSNSGHEILDGQMARRDD